MSLISFYTYTGPKKPITRAHKSALLTFDEEQLESGNQAVAWIPRIWGAKPASATKLREEADPERKAWAALSKRATSRWLRENS